MSHLMKTFLFSLMLLPLLMLLMAGCGTQIKVKGGTTHEAHSTVEGEVRTVNEIVLKIDVTACESLNGQDQAQCIKDTVAALGDLVELIKSLSCKDSACLESINE